MESVAELRGRANRWRRMARLISDEQAEAVLLALAERTEMEAAKLEASRPTSTAESTQPTSRTPGEHGERHFPFPIEKDCVILRNVY